MIAGFFALSSIFRAYVTEQFYDELTVHTEELQRLDQMKGAPPDSLRDRFSDPRYGIRRSGFYWEVQRPGSVNVGSASLEGASLGEFTDVGVDPARMRPRRSEGPTGALLLMALRTSASPESPIYIVGTDERHLNRAVADFDRVLALSLVCLGAVLLVSVIGFVTSGMAPFRVLARDLRLVRSGEVARLDGSYPTEVAPLVDELNSMIQSQQASLQRARAHAGNLAHGLKGPLAIIADEAYQLDQRGENQSGAVITEQCRAMQLHIDHHIARTRAQAMARTPGTRSNIARILASLCSALTRLHSGAGVALEQEFDPGLYSILDDQDLNELAANLVDNAFKFARSRVIVRTFAVDGAAVCISVEDDGPGLPVESREIVFAPGARLDETKPGSGLGLAIVRDLVELYGGEIAISESPLGGLQVRVLLPRADA